MHLLQCTIALSTKKIRFPNKLIIQNMKINSKKKYINKSKNINRGWKNQCTPARDGKTNVPHQTASGIAKTGWELQEMKQKVGQISLQLIHIMSTSLINYCFAH